jgi:acyl-CoA thioester hydrolase
MTEVFMQKLNLRIDWGDLDLLGHVNNVSIIRYLQAGRVMFMGNIGLPVFVGMKTGPIEAATEIQFRKQLHFPGDVTVCTTVREVKNTSIVLEHKIYDDAEELAVSAMEVIVYFDFVNQTKIPLTDEIRNNIAAYLATLS